MLSVDNVSVRIVYEDNHLLCFNKPGGMLTQGDSTGDPCVRDVLIAHIKVRDNKPGNVYLHPCHRLDRTVSGVILMAKTSKALTRMHKLFKDRQIAKTYLALCVSSSLNAGQAFEVEGYIKKNRSQGRVMFKPHEFDGGKYALTHGRVVFKEKGVCGVVLTPQTGRPHQLRVHLASRGMTILGDVRYGEKPIDPRSIHLHASSLSFIHPVKKEEVTMCAALPKVGIWPDYEEKFKPFLKG